MILSPSVLSADFTILGRQLDILYENGIDHIHYDIMDGHYVPPVSFGEEILKCIRKRYPDLYVDAHLMVENPESHFESLKEAGADSITVHAEVCGDLRKTVEKIQSLGMKAGVTVNPETGTEAIKDVLDIADLVLIMSVHPGYGGQKLIPECLDKVRRIAELKKRNGYRFSIQIDGGVGLSNLSDVIAAGADNIVAGSAVFRNDISKNIKDFMEVMK